MYDIIIIGAGPAGMTAALYAKRANKKVLVLEALNYGGQIINTVDIENYPTQEHISGYDFATKLYNQITELGVEIIEEKVISIENLKDYKKVNTKNNIYKAKAIIIATGTDNRKLNIENEDKFIGKGISYCATCDGSFYKNKNVCVVGGGNTALEEAIYLSNICNTVYLIHRRDKFRADQILIDKLNSISNIKLVLNATINKLNGNEKLDSIDILSNNKIDTISTDALFIAIGKIPMNDIFKDIIEIDEYGYIVSDKLCHTNIPGIFVAGDIREKSLRQLVTATSDGALAATEAVKYINQ
ncbi:MAG: thioredoxin-disulfide reductase [Bacilli bacterium]|nr:thioredoxin-disulfide reductase [Bacilli bacterium]